MTKDKNKNKNVNKRIKLTHKVLVITILTLIILIVSAVFVINRTSIIGKIKQAIQKEEKPLFAYEIYDNQDENNIKVLVTVNSEDGIEYVVMPNKTRIDCYNKTTKAIDYVAAKDSTSTFKVKEKGKDEKIETIKLDDQAVYNNGVALDETDQSGYKEFTAQSKLTTLKNKFTTCTFKIGENGTWVDPNKTQMEEYLYKSSAFDYDIVQNNLINDDSTVTIYTKLNDSMGNAIISKKTYSVDTTQNESTVESESLIKAAKDYNNGNGKYGVTVSDQAYSLKVYTINGNVTIDANSTMGTNNDIATGEDSANMAKNMLVLKVNGDLTINGNSSITTYSGGYGGPKGLMIYCTGTITNNGEITQTGKGAHAEGQNVYLLKNTDGSYEYIPAEGGKGGNSVTASYQETVKANKGEDGENRQTGGGSSGSASSYTYRTVNARGVTTEVKSGAGSAGTSYSGGLSGTNGSASGYIDYWSWGAYKEDRRSIVPGTDAMANGGNSAGGLLIIYGNNITNSETGKITANGNEINGGGSINIFYDKDYKNENVIESNGSGKGTVTIGISDKKNESKATYGTEIQPKYEELYTSTNPTSIPTYTKMNYSGNTDRLVEIASENANQELTTRSDFSSKQERVIANGSLENHDFSSQITNQWVQIFLGASDWTTNASISNFKLKFEGKDYMTLQEGVDNKLIEPLVLYGSPQFNGGCHIWNVSDFINKGNTDTGNYPSMYIYLKVKKNVNMTGIQFSATGTEWRTGQNGWGTSQYPDGLQVFKYPEGWEISTKPIED